jgi:hypothetical protein
MWFADIALALPAAANSPICQAKPEAVPIAT